MTTGIRENFGDQNKKMINCFLHLCFCSINVTYIQYCDLTKYFISGESIFHVKVIFMGQLVF